MMAIRVLYQLARADFLERVRRYSFLLSLGFCLYLSYAFVPPNHAKYATLHMGEYRGLYNSAWIGTQVALLCSTIATLIGFYLVKNAVDRDRQTGVGQILAATPMSKLQYTAGKALSNFAVLSVMVAVIAIVAAAMQLIRGEAMRIEPWKLFGPFLLLTLPAMALVSAVAVFFESARWLRGGGGNVAFFFLWTAAISSGAAMARHPLVPFNDVGGSGVALSRMMSACKATFPDYQPGHMAMGVNIKENGVWDLQTFVWEGIAWTPQRLWWRAEWLFVALGIALLATVFFDRFDPSRAGWIPIAAPARNLGRTVWERFRRKPRNVAAPINGQVDLGSDSLETPAGSLPTHGHLTALPASSHASNFRGLLLAELKLTLKGVSKWWFAVAIGMAIAGAAIPLDGARLRLLPFIAVWPILRWSPLGARELRHGTNQLIFSSPHPLRRQLLAAWLAGCSIALLTGGTVGIRLILSGEMSAAFAWLVGVAFVPALALALGVWTGGTKFFEALYIVLWYMGPLQSVPFLDFMGASKAAVDYGMPWIFLTCTIVLLAAAFLGRRQQLQN